MLSQFFGICEISNQSLACEAYHEHPINCPTFITGCQKYQKKAEHFFLLQFKYRYLNWFWLLPSTNKEIVKNTNFFQQMHLTSQDFPKNNLEKYFIFHNAL